MSRILKRIVFLEDDLCGEAERRRRLSAAGGGVVGVVGAELSGGGEKVGEGAAEG